uniref:Dihydrofolate reductase n=1 Tax=Roseihalotalea indica TaxID=2867963 RepID=A0AA49JJA8_9BACT|nr:dihydrofolate reductase [Tunicatimonas sp. TK19036]
MITSIMVARSDNNVIGKENDLVWHMPADLKYFKKTTMGHHAIMGRKTFESMDKPLPGRTNIIITRNPDYQAEGCMVVSSLEEAFQLSEEQNQEEVFVLGGGEIYRMAMDLVDRIYLTEIHSTFEGDTFFPEIDRTVWKEIKREEHEADKKNPHSYAFVVLERR